MDMFIVRLSQSSIEKAARETGISMTAKQAHEIAEAEGSCLSEYGRVLFGDSAAAQLVREFSTSPYLSGSNDAETLKKLVEAFYELRKDFPANTTDIELLEALQRFFDGEAAGDPDLATYMARELLSISDDLSSYEIADDDGKVYRWSSEEWHDNVYADGWYGERWDDDE